MSGRARPPQCDHWRVAIWEVVQGFGALAGIAALGVQGVSGVRRRRAPRDIDSTRQLIDACYDALLPVASRPSGTPSLDMVGDEGEWRTPVYAPSFSNRIRDKQLREAIREAGLQFHLAFALGTNLNGPIAERDPELVQQQLEAAKRGLAAIRTAQQRLDDIERRL